MLPTRQSVWRRYQSRQRLLGEKQRRLISHLKVCCLSCILETAVFFGVDSSSSRSTIALASCRSLSFILTPSSPLFLVGRRVARCVHCAPKLLGTRRKRGTLRPKELLREPHREMSRRVLKTPSEQAVT